MKKIKFKQTEIGMIPEDWGTERIGDVAEINEISIDKNFKFDKIGYIDITSVDKGRILKVTDLHIKDAPSRAKRLVKNNDIIISTVRPNLKHFAFIKNAADNLVVSTGFAVLSAKKVNPGFLYYFITTQKYTDYLSSIADTHTSTYPSFNPDVIENTLLPLPPISQQVMISKILSSLDSKIELNQRMNKTLEAIGKAIFKRWFVDFEFPNEEGKPYKSSGGEMVFNEEFKKEIPKGWGVRVFSDEFNLTRGQSPPGASYNERGEGIIFFQGRTDFGFRYPKNRVYCTEPARFAEKDTTLLSVRAPVGDLNMTMQNCCIGRGLAAIIHKTKGRSYTYYSMHSVKKKFESFDAEGTVFGSVSKTDMGRIRVISPSAEIIRTFEEVMFALDESIEKNELQIESISQIRDSLLPRLMSGKIRVPVEVG